MRPTYAQLPPYPFDRLRTLIDGTAPPAGLDPIRLTVGAPRRPIPEPARAVWNEAIEGLSGYPPIRGGEAIRTAIARWLEQRFLDGGCLGRVDPERQILPVSGTREALFAIAQALIDPTGDAVVLHPDPGYQIYVGAARFAGARPVALPCRADTGFLPDFSDVPDEIWQRTRLVYVASPGNPTGAVCGVDWYASLFELAERWGFVVVADECYSELYPSDGSPPPGALEACARTGRNGFERVLCFNSLSKRSSVPGLRSGFVAGDAELIDLFARFRTWHGVSMSGAVQRVSVALWSDEAHVVEARRGYDAAYEAFLGTLGHPKAHRPAGSFYVWLDTGSDDTEWTRRAWAETGVLVLPGSFLVADADRANPARGYVRISLVEPPEVCAEAGRRLARMFD
ncbi:MAG: aminotransferase class I/II-fold pyridoxal phosphate-dependent enzyme [Candidatus Dadabacteria bacterium]|nr:MAG: aminotransferase class I/II-fold pyridoxal phosphate-dependent enzyme [Candidatus Dadabacteria bacterium]